MIQPKTKMRVSSQYIGRPQYLLDPSTQIASLFESEDEDTFRSSYLLNELKIGYCITLRANGLCNIQRYLLAKINEGSRPDIPANLPVQYTTEETLDLWDFEAKKGWVSLEDGEWWQSRTSLETSNGYGYILGTQAVTYLMMRGLSVRLIDLSKPIVTIIDGKTVKVEGTAENGKHMLTNNVYLIEVKALPKNPLCSRRKRQIVYT